MATVNKCIQTLLSSHESENVFGIIVPNISLFINADYSLKHGVNGTMSDKEDDPYGNSMDINVVQTDKDVCSDDDSNDNYNEHPRHI